MIFVIFFLQFGHLIMLTRHDWASLVTQQLRTHLPMQEMQVQPLGQEDFLEKEMATLQYACLGNTMDREACSPWGHKSQTQLSN